MKIERAILLGATLLLVAAAEGGVVNLHTEMHDHVAPQAQVIWDITNNALDDEGNLSAAKVKPQDWARMVSAGGELEASLGRLAKGGAITVRTSNQKLQDEDAPTGTKAAQIQSDIDGDKVTFRAAAATFAQLGRQMKDAAAKQDAKTLGAIAGQLDSACEGCHKAYWYRDQK
jgi:hypothetical protein